MASKALQIFRVLFIITLVGLVNLNGVFSNAANKADTDLNVPRDICGRPLFSPGGMPLYYHEPCPFFSASLVTKGTLFGDRFEDPFVAYSTGGSWVEAVSVDDFDQDGMLDVVVSTSEYLDSARDNRIWIARQGASLTFNLTYSATVGARQPRSLDVADMDGNGYLDIIVANFRGGDGDKGDVEIFWGTGSFTFTRTSYAAGMNPYAVAVMPVYNEYTRTLAAVTNWNDVILSTYLGGAGHTVQRMDYSAYQAGWNQLAVGDLNSDGNKDIAAMWGQLYNVPAFTEYFGDGRGELSVGPSFSKDNKNPSAIAVGDITNDGLDDIIIARGGNRPYAEVLVYAQDSSGNLHFNAAYPSYDMPESLDVADVNCDGLNDLIATNAGWRAFSWWPGQPDGTLGSYQIEPHSFYFSHIGPNGAEMADVNGDGLKDYVVVDYNVDGILIALQRPCLDFRLYLPLIIRGQTG